MEVVVYLKIETLFPISAFYNFITSISYSFNFGKVPMVFIFCQAFELKLNDLTF